MKVGRKPTPTALKLVKGNPGKRAINTNEPQPVVELPRPPVWLSSLAKKEWRDMGARLLRVGLITDIDKPTFAAYCDSWGRWQQAELDLRVLAARDPQTHGTIITTPNGALVQNPLLSIINRQRAACIAFAALFGMNPSDRTRLDVGISSPPAIQGAQPAATGTARYF